MAAVTTRLRSAPAAMFATEPSVSLAFEVADVTSRLSWKLAEVSVVFAMLRLPAVPTRRLPSARVEATVGLARS